MYLYLIEIFFIFYIFLQSGGDISLQLRPTLPRKQFDIPRFSPTAAWRLLTALESPTPVSPNYSGGEEDLIPIIDQPHNSGDKSGDSGISGDASPHSAHNSQVIHKYNSNVLL